MNKTIYIIIGYWGNWEDSDDEIVGGYFTDYEEAVKTAEEIAAATGSKTIAIKCDCPRFTIFNSFINKG